MALKTICFGFDGICCDMSFFIDLDKNRNELLIKYPFLEPILDLLLAKQPQDCELQFESTEFGFETFFDCLSALAGIANKKTTHIGANSAIETVTAVNLLKEPAYPIDSTKVYYLGNYSPDVSTRLPKEQRIANIFLEHANTVKTSYSPISIIIPYKEKRGIISFGGLPPIRRVESLKPYLLNLVSTMKKVINPDLMALLGTTNVYATTPDYKDFELFDPFLSLYTSSIDLGGTVGWDYGRLKQFYQMVEKSKIVMGNDDELRSWYNFKFRESVSATDPLTLYKLAAKLRKTDQILVCHTKAYQFVIGLESANNEIIKDCMNFANKATVVKTNLDAFPTAKQVQDATLTQNSLKLPELLESSAIVTRSVDQKIANPVGLGDVWSCTFCLGLLSQNIL